jgi:hypothetical protein
VGGIPLDGLRWRSLPEDLRTKTSLIRITNAGLVKAIRMM